jgi:two-component system nitrogen regulation sensor histidine kinase GlnL
VNEGAAPDSRQEDAPAPARGSSMPGPVAASNWPWPDNSLPGFDAFDQLATMVALVDAGGACHQANSALENVLGVSRRVLQRGSVFDWLADTTLLRGTLEAVADNQVSTSRFDATLQRSSSGQGDLPVHVIVSQTDPVGHIGQPHRRLLVEMIEIEQQTRQDREDRHQGLTQANKELVRNLAHEIKNPLGGLRGAAQLLAMELGDKEPLLEYTQVIIHEADRLQALVDRLLAPHRRAAVMGDVNIHEVCERVRALVVAEFPRGLTVERDYDISIPEFRGDREQLIQAVLNIAQNAAQALADRIAAGDAKLVFRTRIARQLTLGRTRYRLALELHVEDNGPGVPEDLRERIFQPLVSGREGGSGLGLTLALSHVQQHQGTIECESVPGHTVFKVLIPLP